MFKRKNKMYFDKRILKWVGPVSQDEIDNLCYHPGDITVGEVRKFDPSVNPMHPDQIYETRSR